MSEKKEPETDEDLESLLHFLRDSRGFDFTGYKRSTLSRRIRKRMADVQMPSYVDYRDLLETSAEEFVALFNTILINVTSFFRDPDAWDLLREKVVPELLSNIPSDQEIRLWSAGCSSGEEAYSLAILFSEALGADEFVRRVKIYATDVDEEALREARAGMYPVKRMESIAAELRDKYFTQNGALFVFRSDLRRRVIFGRHDITRDAPISRLDLLVCRNTLMYFNVEAQTQIIDRFHFALRKNDFLFLGKAEMLLNDADRFEVVNMRQRIFRRRTGEAGTSHEPSPPKARAGQTFELASVTRARQLRDLILDAGATPSLAVDADGVVALINGQARDQFGLSRNDVGRPFQDLEISYRPVELRSLIEQSSHERRPLRVDRAERWVGDSLQYFDILIQPLWGNNGLPIATSITFTDITVAAQLKSEVKRVQEDLETAYEELQSTNEELETTNEELQSSIEELETTNEELQSTNEELETTNEELQSGNEELETMNEEMRIRTEELDEARAFLDGVLTSIAAGVVVLDSGLKVRSWNRGAVDLWGLREDEVLDRAFFSLDFGLPTEVLQPLVKKCLETRERSGPVGVQARNRLGRPLTCDVFCSPFNGHHGGVVLMMEESRKNLDD
ncbi:CheR family methyltransferase [Streptomyces tsukubensis]|uniref:protein-glutamate O-methyltransferase n=1 Tax=Streptomyces tsukubensis TaxID=83656 RepID=A0A1V4A8X5_9ACTN|nr:CheR family methyltransferase [Streptomyces tsukubensis]OON78775.1 chemotaxis protein CheR [Streptomyces tsukubensis]QFR94254.1 PAS domain-containing protein [Streptomyces tsukubensis]